MPKKILEIIKQWVVPVLTVLIVLYAIMGIFAIPSKIAQHIAKDNAVRDAKIEALQADQKVLVGKLAQAVEQQNVLVAQNDKLAEQNAKILKVVEGYKHASEAAENAANQALANQSQTLSDADFKLEFDKIAFRLKSPIDIPELKSIKLSSGQLRAENSLFAAADTYKDVVVSQQAAMTSQTAQIGTLTGLTDNLNGQVVNLHQQVQNLQDQFVLSEQARKASERLAKLAWWRALTRTALPATVVTAVVTYFLAKSHFKVSAN